MFSSPAPQMTPFRGMPSQNRGFGSQDCRLEAKHPHERVPEGEHHFQGPPMHSGGPVADVHAGFEELKLTAGAAIREFYSAVDEDEVALRIGELNSPSFLPMMLAIWVNDSFQRKERDRDLLARLLISLTKSKVVVDTKQLIEG
ncbi:hypothetical protein HAX54_010826 [Datura stramonium]|uniref:MI domain-containing protein n=1 Tax=Datura stramonium TaxID=4076 RepID=A0ABS8TIE9_DATST|nr:hypothetical protein [Datura stramonium]